MFRVKGYSKREVETGNSAKEDQDRRSICNGFSRLNRNYSLGRKSISGKISLRLNSKSSQNLGPVLPVEYWWEELEYFQL